MKIHDNEGTRRKPSPYAGDDEVVLPNLAPLGVPTDMVWPEVV